MKKVLVIASTFPRWKNDTTPSFVFDLSSRLSKEFDVKVIAPHYPNSKKYERMGNVDVYRFQYFYPAKYQKVCYDGGILPNLRQSILAKIQFPVFLLSELLFINKIMKKEKFDAVHAHWIVPHGFLSVFLKNRCKVPLIVSAHGSDVFPLQNRMFRVIQRKVLKACNVCTANSNATKDEIVRRFPEFEGKIKVIPMGVDTNFFRPKSIKNKFKEYKGKRIILSAGRLSEQKGIQFLIKALPSVLQQTRNAKLLIIGEGAYKEELEKLAEEMHLKNEVEFIGAVPKEKLVDYYNLADIVVMPSLAGRTGTEGLGLVLLEAMSCCRAVIGTDTGGIMDIIKDNENGLLVKQRDSEELANKIIKLINNDKLRDRIGKNGREFVAGNYSWDSIARKFSEIYKAAMKNA